MKRLFSTKTSESALSIALLILRLGAGSAMLMNHGLDKLIHFSQKAGGFTDPFGLGSTASLSMTIFAEFFCAVFIILGLFTRLAAIPLVINMSVALFMAHNGDFFGKGELAGLFLVCFITLLLTGAGKASLDRFLAK
jgi:putative oxidoreductase